MSSSFHDHIEQMRLLFDQEILLPTPLAFEALLRRARAEAIPVGQLFVVSRPLFPGVHGDYQRETRELWCLLDVTDPEGERKALQCLLSLMVHARREAEDPRTIEEDWQREHDAWQEAAQLAQAWGLGAFSQADLEERLAEVERLSAAHLAAGALAGSADPHIARAAYGALLEVRATRGWDEQQWAEALAGVSEDEEANTAVLSFDRTQLRRFWRVTAATSRQPKAPPFGALTLLPMPGAASILRRALKAAAERQIQRPPLHPVSSRWQEAPLSLHLLQVAGEGDLAHALDVANVCLIETAPELAAEAQWAVYGQPGGDHLYRLSVGYLPVRGTRQPEETLPAAQEVWVCFLNPVGKRQRLEAAWQGYITGWQRWIEIDTGTLTEGLSQLWSRF
jgi:hypothetical protein